MSHDLLHAPWPNWRTLARGKGFLPGPRPAGRHTAGSAKTKLRSGLNSRGDLRGNGPFSQPGREEQRWQAAFLTDRPNHSNRKAVFSEPSKSPIWPVSKSKQNAFQQPAAPVREIQRESPADSQQPNQRTRNPPGVSKQKFSGILRGWGGGGIFLYLESTQSSFTTKGTFPYRNPFSEDL